MVSGALLLSPDYELSIRKILHKLMKLLVVWIVWSAVFALVEYPGASIWKYVVRTFKGPFHFWFFEYLAAVYLISPLLKAIVSYQNGKIVRYAIICWFVLGILRYTANGIAWHNEEIRVITNKIHFELCDFSGYFLLGYYLSKDDSLLRIGKSLWSLAFIVLAVLQLIVSRSVMFVDSYNLTVIVVLEAVCTFMFCQNTNPLVSPWITKALTALSASSMGVFIIHPLVMRFSSRLFGQSFSMPIQSMMLFFIVLIVPWAISLLLCRIPFIKKWLLSL